MSALNGVVVRPGDTLLVCLERDLPDKELEQLAADIKAGMDIKVSFLTGVSQLAVYRPDGD